MTPVPAAAEQEALRGVYPDRDGKPRAENTKQLQWIALLYGNLCALFADRQDVFVAADNLWYPVEGRPDVRQAPDVYVAFGRPKGDHRSASGSRARSGRRASRRARRRHPAGRLAGGTAARSGRAMRGHDS